MSKLPQGANLIDKQTIKAGVFTVYYHRQDHRLARSRGDRKQTLDSQLKLQRLPYLID
jgi:hypothetical protein